MKKIIMGLLLLFSFLAIPITVNADDSSFSIGLSYYHFDYKEDLTLPKKSTETGWVPGLYLSFEHKKKANLYTKIYGSYASADVTYDGSTQGGTPVNYTDSKQKFFKFEWDIGYTIPIGSNFSLIPYLGYGYFYWQRGQAKITSTYSSFEEDYSWSYMPVGVKLDYNISENWNIGATAAVQFMFNGRMKGHPSQIQSGVDDPEFDLGNKPAYYFDIPVTYKISPHWSIECTPWYLYSQIGQSNNVNITYNGNVMGYAYEPASTTKQYGANLGVSYSF